MVAGLQSSEGFAHLDVQENTCLARSRCWLGAGSSAGAVECVVASPCGLGLSQRRGWVLKESVPKGPGKSC